MYLHSEVFGVCEGMVSFIGVVHEALPLKAGHILHTPIPPTLSHCPRDSSNRYIGIPANSIVNKYGNRNAPVNINKACVVKCGSFNLNMVFYATFI